MAESRLPQADPSPGVLLIRSGRESDSAEVLALWRRADVVRSATDDTAALVALVNSDKDSLLVAETKGTVVGVLVAAWDGWRGNMYRLAVDPAHRRRGVARRLIEAGEERLRQRGARRITALLVAEDRTAVELWRAAG